MEHSSASVTTAGPTHKRNASINKTGTKPTGSTVVFLFVTNLRLLNLDVLPDWPHITVSSFSNYDARTKIKCTEYALYHLFRIYDTATTADKLQPFFPPLEPLQSVNLRSALFRCLNELKKNGVLSKETVLRKTMLDECQGDKFWEVCLAFSAVVLRKNTLERRAKYSRPVAERHGTAHAVNKSQRESMLPLAIAHKAALSRVLDEKQRKRSTYMRLYELLVEKDDELRQRKVKAHEFSKKSKAIQPEKLNAVEKAIQKSWVGSTELKDSLIDGDTCAKGDGVLVGSFEHLWQEDGVQLRHSSAGAEVGLLQSLNSKATQQSIRLRKWQSYHDRLLAAKPASARSSRPNSGTQKLALRFDRHRDLNTRDFSADSEKQAETTHQRHDSVMRYDEILTAMREELRKNSSHRSKSATSQSPTHPLKRAHTQPVPARKPNIALDTSAGARDPHARSPSQTAVPVKPRMGRRVSSQSKTYEKRKVEGQREPIPLKSELFSPLKDKRRSSVSPSFAMSTLPSPAEEEDSPGARIDGDEHRGSKDVGQSIEARETVNGHSGHDTKITKGTDSQSPILAGSSPATAQEMGSLISETQFKRPALPERKQHTASNAVRPSLAERTRMSIAFNSSENVTSLPPEELSDESIDTETNDELPDPTESEPTFDRRTTLLERTRQSISMAPPSQHVKSKQSMHNRSRASVYPINQFQTPKKARRSTVGIDEGGRRDITPLDQLLSPDAEYASVFKSRPKIAMSPVLSPRQDTNINLNGTLEDDIGSSSPLVDVGGRG